MYKQLEVTMNFPPMPLLPISSPATIDACKSLQLRPSDVFICSYPKSGTTWTQHIVLTLILYDRHYRLLKSYRNTDSNHECVGSLGLDYDHVSDYAPFFEIDAHWDLQNGILSENIRKNHDRLNQRVFNTHLRWDMLPKSKETAKTKKLLQGGQVKRPACGKFIYVTRNLLDVCASFYHHLSNQEEGRYTESFQTFARDWMDGKVAFGSPIHHLLSFAEGFKDNCYDEGDHRSTNPAKTDRPLLLLSYEDMKCNLREQVFLIMNFLNLNQIPVEVLDNEILPMFDFQSMKANAHRFQPKSVTWLNGFQFLRKGESGEGRALMGDSTDGEEGNKFLLSEYDKWLNSEGYRDKIDKLFEYTSSDEETKRLRNVFIRVVDLS